jgi:signal transduction histidine kinase
MAGQPMVAPTAPQYPTIQQALHQCLVETAADAVFLAMPGARSPGRSFSIVALYPPAEQSTSLMTQWIHKAVSHTLDSGRTTLTVGRRHATTDHPKRSALLIVASVFNGDDAVCGALAALLPSTDIDSAAVAILERSAREIKEILVRRDQIPAPAEPTSPLLARSPGVSEAGTDILMHELRVPLGAANYALEALAMRHNVQWDYEDEQLMHTAQFGVMEAQSILRSANQLQAISSLATPNLRAVSLKTALERSVGLFPAAHSRLRLDLRDDLPLARADELWLTQVLTNLVENALKYSWPRTLITVAAQPNGTDRILITVQSFGRDLPADQQQLFERNVLDASSLDLASKGLGLSIARQFIIGMGGNIWVESDGYGATQVMLTLPVAST